MSFWKQKFRSFARFVIILGFDFRQIKNLKMIPRFYADQRQFKSMGGKIGNIFAILGDYNDNAGTISGMYFHQDLLIARFIFEDKPKRHIDIGSRVDGFIAHVAAFREVEMLDIRPMGQSIHTNIRFLQADLMAENPDLVSVADSVSCLNALEHFGLGRYGDKIDPNGHITGFRNIARMVKPGGRFYVSFPVGSEPRVEFNAHRVFAPQDVLSWFEKDESFKLERYDYIDDAGDLHLEADVTRAVPLKFGCGLYTFTKSA
jgi:SAM-dependent methyltransferase